MARRTRRTKEPEWLLRSVVEATHDALLVEHGGAPECETRGCSNSALARPRTLFAYGKADVFELAAAYAFGIVRNHPFVDGNKRTAFVAAFVFLRINGRHLVADEVSAASSMLRLAAGEWDEAAFSNVASRECECRLRGGVERRFDHSARRAGAGPARRVLRHGGGDGIGAARRLLRASAESLLAGAARGGVDAAPPCAGGISADAGLRPRPHRHRQARQRHGSRTAARRARPRPLRAAARQDRGARAARCSPSPA